MPIMADLSVLINGLPSKLGSQDSLIGIDGYLSEYLIDQNTLGDRCFQCLL